MKKEPKIKTLLGLHEEELLLKESPTTRQQKKNDKKAAEEKAKKAVEDSSTKTVTEEPEEKPIEEKPIEEKPEEKPAPSKSKEDEINDKLEGFISNMVLSAWNFEENKGKTEILIKALKRVLNLANSLRKLEVKETAEEVENEKA